MYPTVIFSIFSKCLTTNLQNGKPGEDWLYGFMQRWKLSTKLQSTVKDSRQVSTDDPDVVNAFYDTVEIQKTLLNIPDGPKCTRNVDAMNRNIDLQSTKVVALKGQKTSKSTATRGKETETLNAGISKG